jgi:hypothetical protein
MICFFFSLGESCHNSSLITLMRDILLYVFMCVCVCVCVCGFFFLSGLFLCLEIYDG